MAKVSKASTEARDQGGAGTEWSGDLDGYRASFVAIGQDADLTELLRGLPNDQCPSPHWGYVIKGSVWFLSDAGRETIGAGDAFYIAPGHTSGASAGSEFVIFSPAEILNDVEAHMGKRAQELFGAHQH